MKSLITVMLSLFSVAASLAQAIPKDQYFFSKTAEAVSLTNQSYYALYKKSSVYYNDKVAVISVAGLYNTPVILKVGAIKRNVDNDIEVSCYTNELYQRNLDSAKFRTLLPTLTLKIDDHTTMNWKPSTTITLTFNYKAFNLVLSDAKTDLNTLALLRKKYQ